MANSVKRITAIGVATPIVDLIKAEAKKQNKSVSYVVNGMLTSNRHVEFDLTTLPVGRTNKVAKASDVEKLLAAGKTAEAMELLKQISAREAKIAANMKIARDKKRAEKPSEVKITKVA